MHKKIILFFIIYFITFFLFFTYILFPAESIKKKIEYVFSQYLPGQLLINDFSLKMPAHISMKKLQILFNNDNANKKPTVMYIDEIRASPNFLKIFTGKIWINLYISLSNGIINAQVGKKLIGSPVTYLFCNMKDVSIQDLPVVEQQLKIHITGIMEGEAGIKFLENDFTKGEGIWFINIENGRITPSHFPSFNYNKAYGKGLIKENKIQIEEIKILGEDISLQAAGNIQMGHKLTDFYVDTQVKLKLFPRFQKKLGFISNFLPSPDKEGYINIPIYGHPNALRFSS